MKYNQLSFGKDWPSGKIEPKALN